VPAAAAPAHTHTHACASAMASRARQLKLPIPTSIITGHLGCGKSTAISSLIARKPADEVRLQGASKGCVCWPSWQTC
jgi:predicted ATPase